jgi:hypothetical protein
VNPRTGTVLVLILLLGVASCASAGHDLSGDPANYGSPTAEMAVRRFLNGIDARDYMAMGRQFGTRQGPAEARMGTTQLEQRMIVLAGLLRHDDYSLRREDLAQLGPHRSRFVATLSGTREGEVALPFVTARTEDGRWYVERIDVNPLTRAASSGG